MPIVGRGWELHVVRSLQQAHSGNTRTMGSYQVYRDGVPVPGLSGATAEPAGPGDNSRPGCGQRVEPGVYPLATHDGDAYCSIDYVLAVDPDVFRKPALRLEATGRRTDILVHPGHGFLASEGCINPSKTLCRGTESIDFEDSCRRVVAMIEDLVSYSAEHWPGCNNARIPRASVTIEDAPAVGPNGGS